MLGHPDYLSMIMVSDVQMSRRSALILSFTVVHFSISDDVCVFLCFVFIFLKLLLHLIIYQI